MSAESLINMLSDQEGTVATVKRLSEVLEQGYPKQAYVDHLLSVKVTTQLTAGNEAARHDRESERKTGTFYAVHGIDIKAKDKLVINSRWYDVQTSEPRGFDSLAHQRIEVEETEALP